MKTLLLTLTLIASIQSFADGMHQGICNYIDIELTARIQDPDFECKVIKNQKARQSCKMTVGNLLIAQYGAQSECKMVRGRSDFVFIKKK